MEAFLSFLSPRKPQAERLTVLLSQHGLNPTSSCVDDSFFDRIAHEMRLIALPEEWSRRPRIYWILHQIRKVDLMDDFIFHGHYDTSIPYNGLRALPRSDVRRFNHSDAQAFLEWQRVCTSKRLQFEQGEHIRLDDGDILFEDFKVPLGNGSSMRTTVDKVISKATGRVYARKRIKRNKLPKEAQKEFERELRALKEVEAHEHLIRVCGTYTDKRYLTLLLEPVAEGTLKAYLLAGRPRTLEERIVFCTFFGCMAKVLSFLHDDKQIIHKDIKSDNFLLLGGRIILTDFGTAFDFSKTGHSMTRTNSDDGITLRYASPEVVRDREFHRASDIWSLGIVFLEMATVLLKKSLKQLDSHLASHNNKSVRVYENRDAALSWLKELSKSGCSPIDNEPLAWIRDMLEQSHRSRPTAAVLFTTCSTCQSGRFCGKCCSGLDTGESDMDSDSDLLSSHPDVSEDEFPTPAPRAPEVATIPPKNMPGAFPIDGYYIEHREPLFAETLQPSFADRPGRFLSGPTQYRRNSNVGPKFASIAKKQLAEADQNQQMVSLKNWERESRSKSSRSPDARRVKSRQKSRSRKASEATVSTTTTSLTITDQRLNHFLTSLPPAEQFDKIVEDYDPPKLIPEVENTECIPTPVIPEPLPKAVSPTDHSNHKDIRDLERNWIRQFKSARPVKVHSQENLRHEEEKAPYRAEDTVDVCAPPIIRYPSDTDLRRHHVELDDREPDFINSLKRWSANFKLPEALRIIQDIQFKDTRCNNDQKFHTETCTNTSSVAPELPTASNVHPIIDSKVLSSTEEVKSREERNGDIKLPAHKPNPDKKHKAVTFSEEVEILVDEIPSAGVDEGVSRPTEANIPTSGPQTGDDPSQLTSSSTSSSIVTPTPAPASTPAPAPAPLGIFLEQVPETKRPSKRNWEAATEVMRRILDDKASVAPTSVISKRTKQMLRGGPLLMKHNDAYYGYLPHFVKLGKVSAVRELLAGGCNPGTEDKPRWQPLFLAVNGATDAHNKCLLALVNHGANLKARNSRNGKTYLHYAVAQEPWPGYSTAVYILLKTGADPNAKDCNGATPFLSLLTGAGPLDQEERNALLIFLAPNFKTSVNIRDPNLNDNAFHLTIRRQDPYALDAVLDAFGTDEQKKTMLAERNASGYDPLLLILNTCSFATEELAENSTRMLELLLKHGADPNSRDETKGDTALHLIISVHKSTAAMELLLRFEASLTIKNKRQISARDLLNEKAANEKADPWYVYARDKWLPKRHNRPEGKR